MAVRIVVDVFSGRENPVIEVKGKEADEVLERLKPSGRAAAAAEFFPAAQLGYRGLIVEQTREGARPARSPFRVAAGLVETRTGLRATADDTLEDFIFSRKGPAERSGFDRKTLSFLRQEISDVEPLRMRLTARAEVPAKRASRVATKRAPTQRASMTRASAAQTCLGGPIFEPAWWNDNGQRQLQNNCYNYSTNYRTDTFAQPGRANGRTIRRVAGSVVKPFAVLDNLIDAPNANNKCPAAGHLVALVIAPGFDFHWYRKGADGLWTHKVGPAPATDRDNSGNVIIDPRNADRGPYTEFTGFMVVMHGHVRLR